MQQDRHLIRPRHVRKSCLTMCVIRYGTKNRSPMTTTRPLSDSYSARRLLAPAAAEEFPAALKNRFQPIVDTIITVLTQAVVNMRTTSEWNSFDE